MNLLMSSKSGYIRINDETILNSARKISDNILGHETVALFQSMYADNRNDYLHIPRPDSLLWAPLKKDSFWDLNASVLLIMEEWIRQKEKTAGKSITSPNQTGSPLRRDWQKLVEATETVSLDFRGYSYGSISFRQTCRRKLFELPFSRRCGYYTLRKGSIVEVGISHLL